MIRAAACQRAAALQQGRIVNFRTLGTQEFFLRPNRMCNEARYGEDEVRQCAGESSFSPAVCLQAAGGKWGEKVLPRV